MIKTETKVGALVLLALIGLSWLTYHSSNIDSLDDSNSRKLFTEVKNASGLYKGSKVKMAGIDIGTIYNITLTAKGSAILHLAINKNTPLTENIEAHIASNGLIGEKFIALRSAVYTEEMLPKEKLEIPFKNSGSLEDIGAKFSSIATNLEGVSESLKYAIAGQENQEKLARIINNIDNVTSQLSGENSTLGQLINSDSGIMDNLEMASDDLASITGKINSGEGSIGRLINDDATIEKVENALDSLSSITQRIEQIQTEIDFYGYSILGQDVAKGRFDVTLSPRPNRFYLLGLTSDGYAIEAEDDRADNDYYGQDYGKELKFSAQFGHVYEKALWGKDLYIRFGLRDSSFGLGADTYLADNKVKLSVDLYDLDGKNSGDFDGDPHLDLTGRYFMENLPLYAIGGIDNALNSELAAPFVGLGLRFNDDDFKYLLQTVPAGGL